MDFCVFVLLLSRRTLGESSARLLGDWEVTMGLNNFSRATGNNGE